MTSRHLILGSAILGVASAFAGWSMVAAGPPAKVAIEAPVSPAPPTMSSVGIRAKPATDEPGHGIDAPVRAPQLAMARQDVPGDDPTVAVAALAPPLWDATIETGDTLDTLLARTEMDATLRIEVALALGAEYDLRQLKPGNRLSVAYRKDGTPSVVTLTVDDGVRIEVSLDDTPTGRTLLPKTTEAPHAARLTIKGSIYASLDRAGIPQRFAVDLAQMLSGTVDFRRDLRGGEPLDILWSQDVMKDGSEVGPPRMTYAALALDADRFEIVWSEEEDGRVALYRNDEAVRTVSPPVEGARLSSVFGRRLHPVYGNYRMHAGIDYAAPKGTPISATGPGRVSFIGWRRGYGRTVEIEHMSDMTTRYAHLSAVPDGLAVGDRVSAGDGIGRVGETGTATAPNLHYEVLIEGRPIDPLGDDMPVAVEAPDRTVAVTLLLDTRTRFASTLGKES